MSAAASTTDREIVITRVFDSPRDVVFQAWIDPQQIGSWWGPKGFTTTTYQMDVRPGGVWRFVMHGPDGINYQNKIVYLEIVKPERLVYDHGDEADAEHFRVTVTFAEEEGKTRLTMRSVFKSAAARDEVVTRYHAIEGGNQTLDRLAEQLAKNATRQELVITRIFDAPRGLVFQAWTEPERLRRWWGPKGFTNPVCEVDARPGGAIRIHMRAPDGTIYPMTGVFQEITAPERLVFTSSALDKTGNWLFEVLTTVTFSEHGGKTKLTLNARVTKATAEAAPHLAGMEQGWSQSLDRLAQEVSA
jgi:uncharacterized protein YndB with AHSA1/START domain